MPSSYTGAVTPGGPTAVRELPDVVIRKASVSAQDNNAYLLTDRTTGEQLLVDAADDAPRLLALVAEGVPDGGAGLATVVTTHQHWDHHRALPDVVAATGARTAAVARAHADGATCVFLVADAQDWPREFYGRLGFEPATTTTVLTRTRRPDVADIHRG